MEKKKHAGNFKNRTPIHNTLPLQEKQKNVGFGDANLPIFVSIRSFAGFYFLEVGDKKVKGRGND